MRMIVSSKTQHKHNTTYSKHASISLQNNTKIKKEEKEIGQQQPPQPTNGSPSTAPSSPPSPLTTRLPIHHLRFHKLALLHPPEPLHAAASRHVLHDTRLVPPLKSRTRLSLADIPDRAGVPTHRCHAAAAAAPGQGHRDRAVDVPPRAASVFW